MKAMSAIQCLETVVETQTGFDLIEAPPGLEAVQLCTSLPMTMMERLLLQALSATGRATTNMEKVL